MYICMYRRSLRPLPYHQIPLLTIPSRRRRRGERVAKSCSGARARTPHLSPKPWRIYIYLSHRRRRRCRRRYSRGMESGYSYIHIVWYIIYRVVLTQDALFVVGNGYFTYLYARSIYETERFHHDDFIFTGFQRLFRRHAGVFLYCFVFLYDLYTITI